MPDISSRLSTAIAHGYRIEGELGEGGMATVYLAEDLKHHRKVAVKVLKPELAAVLGGERFLNEITLTANLQHPHILQLYDSGEADAFLYYVMPYVEGESLRDRLNREGQLPIEEAVEITKAVASALDYAHKRGVIHRDIKPENILLHDDVPLMADFGIALAIKTAGGERLTETGLSVGTPAYMSPEQVAGQRDLDARSDVYALACVTYEMLAGDPPFVASTPQAVMAKHVTDPAPPVTTTRPSVTPAVASALARALHKTPADRHASAGAFASALTADAPQEQPRKPSIVVLPFENLSPDPTDAYLADGFTEELTTDLGRIESLHVIARNSAAAARQQTRDLKKIAQMLDVRFLLEGSVRRAGSQLRIATQLIDGTTDAHLWAEKYSGTMDDVFDVQERVSRAIVDALQVRLTSSEDVRLASRSISDARAFELYLQARIELRRYGASMDHASALLQRAIDIEGESPPLRALRGFMEFSKVRGGSSTDLRPLDVAEAEGRALLELVPDAPYGHALLGFVGYERGQLREAAGHLRKAMELDPTDPDVLFMLCITLQAAGQIEPGQEMAKRFVELDPLSPLSGTMLCVAEWFSGNIGLHVDAMERSLAMDPESAVINWALGYTYALMGRLADATARAAWMRTHAADLSYTAQLSALIDAVEGRREEALATLSKVDLEGLDAHHTFHVSESYAMAGDTAQALVLLERAVDGGMYPYRFYEEFCPFMAPLRGMAEFDRVVAKAARRVAEFIAP